MLSVLSQRRNGFLPAFAGFALLAMMLRALVPVEYMPTVAQDGNFISVTLCTAYGIVDALIDPETGAVVEGDTEGGHPIGDPSQGTPCIFAAVAAFVAPVPAHALPEFAPTHYALVFAQDHVANARHDAEIPWSTGPPSLT